MQMIGLENSGLGGFVRKLRCFIIKINVLTSLAFPVFLA